MNLRPALVALLPLALLGAGMSDAKPPAGASAVKPPAKSAPSSHVMFDADSIHWGTAPPALPKGAQMAVLAGDPDKAGPFTLRLKTPPGYKVALHWHPSDERVTVLQGDFHLQMGTGTQTHAHAFAPGGYVVLPAHMRHAASTQGGTIVQIDSMGPFEIHYVNAKDDPRTAGAKH